MTRRKFILWGIASIFVMAVVASLIPENDKKALNKSISSGQPSPQDVKSVAVTEAVNVPEVKNAGVIVGNEFLIDLWKCTVNGIPLYGSVAIENIVKKIGAANVRKETEYPEGQPNDMYVISFGTHTINKHWNAISFTDSAFRDKNGLGVGSTLASFIKYYGLPKSSSEMGDHFLFRASEERDKMDQFDLSIERPFDVASDTDVEKYSNEKITEIWVW